MLILFKSHLSIYFYEYINETVSITSENEILFESKANGAHLLKIAAENEDEAITIFKAIIEGIKNKSEMIEIA